MAESFANQVDFTDTRRSNAAHGEEPLRLRLRTNFLWTLLGNVVYAGCQWGMIVVLAKAGSPEMVGQFALAFAITAPIFLFASLKLRSVQATDARQEFPFGEYMGLRIMTTALALFAVAVIVIAGGYRRDIALVIVFVGFAKSFESISDIIYGFHQQNERMDKITKSMLIKGPTSLLALMVGIYLTGSVLGGVIGLAVSWAFVLIAYDLPTCRHIIKSRSRQESLIETRFLADLFRWDRANLFTLGWLALPLGLTISLGSLWSNIPRYFLDHQFGERELGIFSAIASLMLVGTTIVGALGQSASPKLAKYCAAGNWAAFDTLTLKLVGLGGLLGVSAFLLAFFAGPQILAALYGTEYAAYANVLFWLIAAFGIQYSYVFCGSAINAMRHFTIQLPIQLTSVIILLLLCFILINRNGLLGAAWAMLGSNAFEAVAFTTALLHLRNSESVRADL